VFLAGVRCAHANQGNFKVSLRSFPMIWYFVVRRDDIQRLEMSSIRLSDRYSVGWVRLQAFALANLHGLDLGIH